MGNLVPEQPLLAISMFTVAALPRPIINGESLFSLYITRKPVVTGKKVILIIFLSIFYSSQFLLHQKISVTTKDTAELNVKNVKHNVITTKSIKMALANLARAGLCQNPRYHG